MANVQTITPEQQAAISGFLQKYPQLVNLGGQAGRAKQIQMILSDPQMADDYRQLATTLGLQDSGPNSNSYVDFNKGQVVQNGTVKEWLIKGGLIAASAPLGGYGLAQAGVLGGGGVAASGGAGATGAAAAPATTTITSAGAGGLLPSTTTIGTGVLPAGSAGIASGAGGGGLLSTVGGFLKGKGGDVLGAIGKGIGDATTAAGANRREDAERDMRGQLYYENELQARAKTEAEQRNDALKNVYRNSWYDNRQPGPYNTRGIQPINAQFGQTLDDLANQGATKLGKGAQYDTDAMTPLKPYEPSKPGILERIGGYAGPVLGGLSTIGKIIGR